MYFYGSSETGNENTNGITINTAFESFVLDGFMWQTEPPKKRGWYWVYTPHEKFPSGPSLVEVESQRGDLGVMICDEEFETVQDYSSPLKTYWLGPLPIPEAPKEG